MVMTKQTQIVELQDLIDTLTRMKLNLQQETGAQTFSDVVRSYSSERSLSSMSDEGTQLGGSKRGRRQREQLQNVRSRLDRLFSSSTT